MNGLGPGTSPSPDRRLSAWFQYFEDIGLRRFYLDRAIAVSPADAAAEPLAAQPLPSAPIPMPVRKPEVAPAAVKPSSLIAPAASVASLFDAADRIVDDSLERIRTDIGDCTRCRLCEQRNKVVFGVGNPKAELVFIGEGPGRDEDLKGEPFVGRAGQLLTQMIEAMGLKREQVYIANVVKCRPPENRTPEKDEIAICSPFLLRQLDVIKPKVIVCLGNVAMQALLATNRSMSSVRGQWFPFRGAKLLPTYHPAYLLRNPPAKADVWADLKKVIAELGLTPPKPAPKR
jgi:uracil-DNA glycosylase family 4